MEQQPGSEIILYQMEDGRTRLEVKLENNTVWLSLNQIAELFQRDKSVISKHIKNVYDENELSPKATVAKFATVQKEGKREVSREIEFYNLDVIIAVGYRVKSSRGTQFRQWATQRLSEYQAPETEGKEIVKTDIGLRLKAAQERRSPRRWRGSGSLLKPRSVSDCACPLAL